MQSADRYSVIKAAEKCVVCQLGVAFSAAEKCVVCQLGVAFSTACNI